MLLSRALLIGALFIVGAGCSPTAAPTTCAELGGVVCAVGETCPEAITGAVEELCCEVACVGPEGTTGDLSTLKIAPPPTPGIYLGQYEWEEGDIATFEAAAGRRTALLSQYQSGVMQGREGAGDLTFKIDQAEQAWAEGRPVLVGAWEVFAGNPGFTVDRLLAGEFDAKLTDLAAQFRAFGKPMVFTAAREPNGALQSYMGGFGPDGTESLDWAVSEERGFAEFDPSGFPNAQLYEGLGRDDLCDGLERTVAAHRYYYDFLVRREGLQFLTFDTFGWAVLEPVADDGSYEAQLFSACFDDFKAAYPGDAFTDWVSLDWYLVDDDDGVAPVPSLTDFSDRLDRVMAQVREVAPGKPVLLTELGFADSNNLETELAASRVAYGMERILSDNPEIRGFIMWSNTSDFPWNCLIEPQTARGDALRQALDANPDSYFECLTLSDGSTIPNCEPSR